ncbi:MAG: hydroxymethylbilane synthase [Candidatus Omnitrophota bacterium]
MAKTYRIGTRTSPLALRQVEEILQALRKFYPHTKDFGVGVYPDFNPVRNNIFPGSIVKISNGVKAEIIGIDTYGDRDKTTPISQIEGTDFFTREIDEALLKGRVDFAVHSAKDLAGMPREGLVVAAQTKPVDAYDALVSKNSLKLAELPRGARIGTSSFRRKAQLSRYRDDFDIADIRGNIQERLEKLDNGDLDGIIIAACALVRLGLEHRITQRIPFEILKPHPLQGALAIVVRARDLELHNLLSVIDSREAVIS